MFPPPKKAFPPPKKKGKSAMVNLAFGSVMYAAVLLGCYDGDTCTVRFENAPPPLAQQSLRFQGFDTPEIRGKCAREKNLAKQAKQITEAYLKSGGTLILTEKTKRGGVTSDKGKYGRLLVRAPQLQDDLIQKGLARPYDGGKRRSWC